MLLAALVDLVLPVRCVGCARPGAALCPDCSTWDGPRRSRPDGFDVVAATRYDGVVRQVLLHHKERGRRDLARSLGGALATAVATSLTDHALAAREVVLVPVPSSAVARRSRGGDHLARPVAVASRRTCVRVARSTLRHTRAVRDSAGLGRGERSDNLDHALAARAPRGRWSTALVVDDIVTTGTTLLEARRALEAAGWRVAGAAVVAATPRRGGPGAAAGRSATIGRAQPSGLASC